MSNPFKSMWRERLELLLSAAVGTVLAFFLVLPGLIELLPTRTVKVYSFSSQFNGEPIVVGEQAKICEAVANGGRLVIRVNGRLNELRSYQNLFQTADQNSGIRIEVDEVGIVALLIADRSELTFLAVPATGTVSPGRFQMLVDIADGRNVTFQLGKSIATGSSESLQPSCANLVVGYGFDASRITSGRIRADFSAFREQSRFISPAAKRVVENEFLRSVSLGVMVFCLIVVALNITDPAARRSATHELLGDDEDSRENNSRPLT